MILSPLSHPLHLLPTEDEPEVLLDKESNIFRFTGKSMPEDPGKVFTPVMDWVSEYVKSPNPSTCIEFKMDYYNSSTARFFVEMLELFEDIHGKDSDIKILWYYHVDDVVIQERGEDLQAVISLPFEFIIYT
ncbi:MAG: hypothetical protein AMS27_09260 [Bacteroides sp. SM23_62_1]|nr:MAG: hypothetical protein AMS27_09260 [Bacteroides sp. SM23_62_1]